MELLVRTISAEEDGTLAINLLDLSAAQSYLADAPLASPNAEKSLNLSRNVNPHYSLELQRFAEIVVTPLLGKNQGFQDFVE